MKDVMRIEIKDWDEKWDLDLYEEWIKDWKDDQVKDLSRNMISLLRAMTLLRFIKNV